MNKHLPAHIKFLKTNGFSVVCPKCTGKIELNQDSSLVQGFQFEIFSPIDYLIFEIHNKTQSSQPIDFTLIKIGNERLKKGKKYVKRVEKPKFLEYNLKSLDIATNLHFTQ